MLALPTFFQQCMEGLNGEKREAKTSKMKKRQNKNVIIQIIMVDIPKQLRFKLKLVSLVKLLEARPKVSCIPMMPVREKMTRKFR